VLVLDEPTAALDPASSTLVFDTLQQGQPRGRHHRGGDRAEGRAPLGATATACS
jgi:hypothetical protein